MESQLGIAGYQLNFSPVAVKLLFHSDISAGMGAARGTGFWCRQPTGIGDNGIWRIAKLNGILYLPDVGSMTTLFSSAFAGIFRFKLSYRDLVAILGERGLSISHTTILRWVIRYAETCEKRWNRFERQVGGSWRVDETFIKVRGQWMYLYRAVDGQGNNVVEQDHRRVKGRLRPMLGFKTFYNARRVIIGIELAQKIHKRQFAIPIPWRSIPAVIWRHVMAA